MSGNAFGRTSHQRLCIGSRIAGCLAYVKSSLQATLLEIGFSHSFVDAVAGHLQLLRQDPSLTSFLASERHLLGRFAREIDSVYGTCYQSVRENFLLDYLLDPLAIKTAGRVLDLGCGPGQLAELLLRTGRADEVVGLDSVHFGRQWASACARFPGRVAFANIEGGGLRDWMGSQAPFDYIFCTWVLHHCTAREISEVAEIFSFASRGGAHVVILEDSLTVDEPPLTDPHGFLPEFKALGLRSESGLGAAQTAVQGVLDYVAVRLLARWPAVALPFSYKTSREWEHVLGVCGISRYRRLFVGFPAGRDIAVPQTAWLLMPEEVPHAYARGGEGA